MLSRIVVGVVFCAFSVQAAESQNFTRQGPSPNPNAPRHAPSQSLRESLADIEAGMRLKDRIKQRWAERKAKRQAEERRAQRGAWDDLVRGRNADPWETGERAYQEPDYPDPNDYTTGRIEPGHIPYNCGHIVGNARARADCQRDWEASDPNDYLNYGR